jgi:hypothetical protein
MMANGLLAIEGEKGDPVHLAHCYDYLRQAIMCAGDTTIEGKTKYGDGWGSSHQCKDIDSIMAWADERPGFPGFVWGDIL